MADSKPNHHNHNHNQQKQSRLQRRAPSSLQINRHVEWNVAIPLLSPLASSPPPLPLEAKLPQEAKPQHAAETEKVTVMFKKWQHPASPFCYDPSPRVPSFVPV